jgi:hypothetical protein
MMRRKGEITWSDGELTMLRRFAPHSHRLSRLGFISVFVV